MGLKGNTALNFGSIGALIGYEISHRFDDSSLHFDRDGVILEIGSKPKTKSDLALQAHI